MTRAKSSIQLAAAIGDQGLYTITNLFLSITVARASSTAQFGIFAVFYSVPVVALSLNRAITGEAMATVHSRSEHIRGHSDKAVALAFSIGTAVAPTYLLLAFITPQSLPGAIPAFVIATPMLLLQDALRFSLAVEGRMANALIMDGVWAAVQIGGWFLFFLSGGESIQVAVWAWVVGCMVSAATGFVTTGVRPRFSLLVPWTRASLALSWVYSIDLLLVAFASQGTLWVVASGAGAREAGALRAAQLLFGPLAAANSAFRLVLLPRAARLSRDASFNTTRYVIRLTMSLTILSLGWVLAISRMPDPLGYSLLGPSWAAARTLVPIVSIEHVAVGLSVGALVGLRVTRRTQYILRVRILLASILLIAVALGARLHGAEGAAAAIAAVTATGTIAWWLLYRRTAA